MLSRRRRAWRTGDENDRKSRPTSHNYPGLLGPPALVGDAPAGRSLGVELGMTTASGCNGVEGAPNSGVCQPRTRIFLMDMDRGAMPKIQASPTPRARDGEFNGPRFGNASLAVRLPLLRPGADSSLARPAA